MQNAITLFYAGDIISILLGILYIAFAVIIFISLNIVNIPKLKIPFRWIILLVIGAVDLVLALFLTGTYLSATIILTAFLIELLSEKKTYTASKIVVFIGACIAIYESIRLMGTASLISIVNGVFGIIFAIIAILSLQDKIDVKIPYEWWIILICGFVIFTWINWIGVGGIIILIGFILILMAY
jgi:hypothetical protein